MEYKPYLPRTEVPAAGIAVEVMPLTYGRARIITMRIGDYASLLDGW